MSIYDDLLKDVPLPRLVRVRQSFPASSCPDLAGQLAKNILACPAYRQVQPGMRIAVAVGSRGINDLVLVVKTVVALLLEKGARPFLVPAMGSHGGATAAGQEALLAALGITEKSCGAPVVSSMETVNLGQSSSQGWPLIIDRQAHLADGIIVINRIKPHVAFQADYESGLMKMIAVGLGKQAGAANCHSLGPEKMADHIVEVASGLLAKTKILFAVGLVENAYHQTHTIAVLAKDAIQEQEPALLALAKQLAPRLFFDQLDVLIMDEIGKDISGTGFDTRVVGRYHTSAISGGPKISRIAVLDLTEASHGNANGIGIVDFTTQRLLDKFRPEQSYPNAITTTVPLSVKLPMVLPNDRLAIKAAIQTCQIADLTQVRLVRIKNTISLGEIEISENLLAEASGIKQLQPSSAAYQWQFSAKGSLLG